MQETFIIALIQYRSKNICFYLTIKLCVWLITLLLGLRWQIIASVLPSPRWSNSFLLPKACNAIWRSLCWQKKLPTAFESSQSGFWTSASKVKECCVLTELLLQQGIENVSISIWWILHCSDHWCHWSKMYASHPKRAFLYVGFAL